MMIPLPNNAIRECPHCGEYKQLYPILLEIWPDVSEEDQYYIFHEPEEFLSRFWEEVESNE